LSTLLPSSSRIQEASPGCYVIHAPAKINLGLRVFPIRADGYHDVETWMVPVSWHDTITYRPEGPLRMEVTGRSEGVPPEPERNLIGKAALLLGKTTQRTATGCLQLHKAIPTGGGMGGGSSDAAHTLVLLNQVWDTGLHNEQLIELAAQLGSDVAFFVRCSAALCTGRGEIMRPARSYYPLYAVLILPTQGISTKEIFQRFDADTQPRIWTGNWCKWAALPADELNQVLANDLEKPAFAFAPWLESLRDTAAVAIGQKVHMTGSGSTLFTLAATAGAAESLAETLTTVLAHEAQTMCVKVLRRT